MTKQTKDSMQKVAGHLRYAAQMHAAQAGYWTLAYTGETSKLGGRAAKYLELAKESNELALEASGLADMVLRGMAL